MNDTRASRPAHQLSMQIYAAFLGGNAPRIQRVEPHARPRVNLRVRVEAVVEPTHLSPFHKPSLRETLERAAGIAIQAIEDARSRLKSTASAVKKLEASAPKTGKPVVLIGPAVKRKPTSGSRAA